MRRAPPGLKRKIDIRTVQELLGHSDVKTMIIYTLGASGVPSPLDAIDDERGGEE